MSGGAQHGADLVRLLAGWIEGTGITLLDLETPEATVRLARHPPPAPIPAEPPAPTSAAVLPAPRPVLSPGTGRVLFRHPARTDPLAIPGRRVREGEVVALIQVGALLLHATAPTDGIVTDLIAGEGDLVGYNTPLLALREDPAG